MLEWERAEDVVAELYLARRQPGSGNMRGLLTKQDAISGTHLIEVKSKRTDKRYSLKRDTLVSLRTRAARLGRAPVIAVVFEGTGCLIILHADADDVLAAMGKRKCMTVQTEMPAPWKRNVV